MDTVDVVVVGGGVCGVIAAQRLAEEGFTYRIVERGEDCGGVWAYRANEYSHLQAHAALYQWHKNYKLAAFPFQKCQAGTVLSTLRRFATDFGLRKHTLFQSEVESIRKVDKRYCVKYRTLACGGSATITASAVFVCSGILGKQYSPELRRLPNMEAFTGAIMYAGKYNNAKNHLAGKNAAKDKDVVILGSGAFGLEAMEAAARAGARSITLVTRPRDRWIVPYSQQFKFIFLSHAPFVPRAIRCWVLQWWLKSLYRRCGIDHMAPSSRTQQSFTGQCNDAFFKFPLQGRAKYIIDEVAAFSNNTIELKGGSKLNGDILVVALGHEIQQKPSFLEELGVGYTTDLHNFAFLGRNPYLGAASDWVWFNVPHGPQKQINSFIAALKACRAGKEKEVRAALLPTSFAGCKGEPLNYRSPSGMEDRKLAYWRTHSAGLTWSSRVALAVKLYLQEWGIWLLCSCMYAYESMALSGWLSKSQKAG